MERFELIGQQVREAAVELVVAAELARGQILVVGCSTSEVIGNQIGTSGSEEVAREILHSLQLLATEKEFFLAIQCCEHLNRALVVERAALERYALEQVAVIPRPHAGGALAACAMQLFADPVVVETISAHAGIDIGVTMIGMHLKRVAVPVRLRTKWIGQAPLAAARTRPKLIGGARAIYE